MLVLTSVLALAGLGLTVLPFVRATELAERRRLSPARAGALTLAGVAAGLLGALLVYRSSLPTATAALPLVLCWAGPGLLAVVREGTPLGGRQGAHE